MTNAVARAEILLSELLCFGLHLMFGTTHQHYSIDGAILKLGNPVSFFISTFTHHVRVHTLEEWVIFELFFAQLMRFEQLALIWKL